MEIHDCKIEALLETVEQLNGQHAIICYNFQHDKTRLLEALKATHLTVKVYEGKAEEEKCFGMNLVYESHVSWGEETLENPLYEYDIPKGVLPE